MIKEGSAVRLYSRHGAEYTDRLPGMAKAFAKLPTSAAILDGELCLIDPGGSAHFYRLMAQMRTSRPDESQLMFMVFDLLQQDDVDLRRLALSDRKRDLDRLCRKSKVPYLRQVETFPDGAVLFNYCSKFGFEGASSANARTRAIRAVVAQLGQDEVPWVEESRRRALSPFWTSTRALADGSPEDAREEA